MGRKFIFLVLLVLSYLALPVYSLVSYYVALLDFFPPDLAQITILNATPGVFLFYWFMNGFITGSRVRKLEILVGLPSLIRLHILGALACVLWVIAHGIIKGLPNSLQAIFGSSAAIIFILLVLSASIQWVDTPITHLLNYIPLIKKFHLLSRERSQYQKQRRKHNFMALAAILVYLHIILSGMAETTPVFRVLATAYFVLAFGLYLYHKLVRPSILRRRGLWELQDIQAESNTVTTLVFKATKANRKFNYRAGQFGFLSFVTGNLLNEEHPFSFSSHADEDTLSFSIQDEGDFTSALRNSARQGDLAVVDGPYGKFYPDAKQLKKPMLYLAGGIGIVPFIGLLKEFERIPPTKPVELFWMNKPDNAMFQSDMERFRTIPHLTIKQFSRSAKVALTQEVLGNVPDIHEREIFVCASKDLTKSILAMLRKLGIKKRRIQYEAFSM